MSCVPIVLRSGVSKTKAGRTIDTFVCFVSFVVSRNYGSATFEVELLVRVMRLLCYTERWIPACARMTEDWIPAFAGTTERWISGPSFPQIIARER